MRSTNILSDILQIYAEGSGDKIYLSNEDIDRIMTILEGPNNVNKDDKNVIMEILETNIKNNIRTENHLKEMDKAIQDIKWLKESSEIVLPDVPTHKPRKVKERIEVKKI